MRGKRNGPGEGVRIRSPGTARRTAAARSAAHNQSLLAAVCTSSAHLVLCACAGVGLRLSPSQLCLFLAPAELGFRLRLTPPQLRLILQPPRQRRRPGANTPLAQRERRVRPQPIQERLWELAASRQARLEVPQPWRGAGGGSLVDRTGVGRLWRSRPCGGDVSLPSCVPPSHLPAVC